MHHLTTSSLRALRLRGHATALALLVGFASLAPVGVQATEAVSTKDIVLERVAPRPAHAPAPAWVRSDAMAVSVLVEGKDGTLKQRSVDALFRTGERMRVKLLASRSGKVSIYNTNPAGITTALWSGQILQGQETISPRMVLKGQTGEDQLHITLEPSSPPPQGVMVWLHRWISPAQDDATAKDIRLDVQSTDTTTYLINPSGRGIVTTLRISHVR